MSWIHLQDAKLKTIMSLFNAMQEWWITATTGEHWETVQDKHDDLCVWWQITNTSRDTGHQMLIGDWLFCTKILFVWRSWRGFLLSRSFSISPQTGPFIESSSLTQDLVWVSLADAVLLSSQVCVCSERSWPGQECVCSGWQSFWWAHRWSHCRWELQVLLYRELYKHFLYQSLTNNKA